MKYLFVLSISLLVLTSCGVKIPYTTQVRDEFALDNEEKLGKVQFFISHTIILNQETRSDNSNTTDNGTLVVSSSSESESVIIPAGTRCIFDSYGTKGEIKIRFENGENKVIPFMAKSETSVSKRYFFDADWNAQGGPKITYGDKLYKVDLTRGSARTAHILVVRKKLQKTKRKERVVKGMKI
jgi:outer membrane lipopolysaccharide assembly protein LptE/RlpB